MEQVKDKRTKAYKNSQKGDCKMRQVPGEVEIDLPERSIGDVAILPEKGIDYSKKENNPGFKLCMVCGEDNLDLNDDGSPKRRRQPEACHDCVYANKDKMIDGAGKVVNIPEKV